MNPLNQHSQSSAIWVFFSVNRLCIKTLLMRVFIQLRLPSIHLNTTKASASSKRKPVETDSQTSPINVGDEEVRPEGVKAAKAKRSNAKGKSVADITTVWEMRKDDLDRKEKLSKLAILDTLLAKTQPLTAAEEEAKNKLLAQYI
ncbi:hypothetical protein Bca52824_059973 [Brassica carinata]|uniref:No apical meristem-associated C-terminal domain-containing protein n=1 Tax=Brassica carinata TaxID=52824 RepID=A0A8X7QVB8_BRACI|nr:hypothetical protein Bca52824_059973 [Brassica carinata]